jgi:hypothetical protein
MSKHIKTASPSDSNLAANPLIAGAARGSDHNKHNNGGQAGHKAQKHGAAEEKH